MLKFTSQKGAIEISTIAAIIIVAAIVGSMSVIATIKYYEVINFPAPVAVVAPKLKLAVTPTPLVSTPPLTPSSTITPIPTSDIDISNWETYNNINFAYSINYPKDWYLYFDNSSDVFIQPHKEDPPGGAPGPHADAFEIIVSHTKTGVDLLQLIKPGYDFAGIDFIQEAITIEVIQGLKIVSTCDGLGCGVPDWYIIKDNFLYHFTTNLGYSNIFDQILSTFRFTKNNSDKFIENNLENSSINLDKFFGYWFTPHAATRNITFFSKNYFEFYDGENASSIGNFIVNGNTVTLKFNDNKEKDMILKFSQDNFAKYLRNDEGEYFVKQ